jgi:hypothetical protein
MTGLAGTIIDRVMKLNEFLKDKKFSPETIKIEFLAYHDYSGGK